MLVSLAWVSEAQVNFSHTASNPTGVVVNTASDTLTYTLTTGYNQVTIQPFITRNSGTLAGTVVLYYSVYRTGTTNWVPSGDTLTLSNGAVSAPTAWTKNISAKRWRIITTGSGTVNMTTAAALQTD